MGVAAAWLGLIEGVSDGLSSFAKMGSGYYTDKLPRRKFVAVLGYLVTERDPAAHRVCGDECQPVPIHAPIWWAERSYST
jgi:hypothetical protein